MKLTEETAVYLNLLLSYQKFRSNYKKLIKYGFWAIIILPFVFLLMMFSLEAKIVFLVLWIISVIICSVFIIIIEYTDYHYKKVLNIKENEDVEEFLKIKIAELSYKEEK